MDGTKSDLEEHLEAAIESIEAARAVAQEEYKVRMPLDPELKVLRAYLKEAPKWDKEGLKRRPGALERHEKAVASGQKGGERKSRKKNKSSAANLNKWRAAEKERKRKTRVNTVRWFEALKKEQMESKKKLGSSRTRTAKRHPM